MTIQASLKDMLAMTRGKVPQLIEKPIVAIEDPDLQPTDEQMARARYVEETVHEKTAGGGTDLKGKAYRRKPMIDILFEQDVISEAEHKALWHYRHHADIADRSPMRNILARQPSGGSGSGPTIEMLNACRVRDDCERAAGSLRDILRAIVVYDLSLSQWAMERSGATERCEKRKGKEVCWMVPSKRSLDVARLDFRMAAKRVQAEVVA